MPTDEWFKENPKISAYISPNLNEKLSEWMKNRGIKKVSQALTTILEVHLGVNQDRPNIESSDNDRLRIVEEKLESLSQEVRSLTERNEKNNQRVVQTELFPVEPLEETLLDNKEITLIDTEKPIDVLEEIQDDEPEQVLDDLLKLEIQDSTQEADEELITTDKSEEVQESSPKIQESSPISESQEFKGFNPIMTNAEVSKLINKSVNTIRSRYAHKKEFQAKGYHFSPVKEEGNPRWKVEEIEKDEF
jgi:hypothetical protein